MISYPVRYYNIHNPPHLNVLKEEKSMDEKEVYGNEVRKLRDSMGMNRKKFCDYYGIPYRTVQDWEAGKRKMPSYVLRMMKYVAEKEQMIRVS